VLHGYEQSDKVKHRNKLTLKQIPDGLSHGEVVNNVSNAFIYPTVRHTVR